MKTMKSWILYWTLSSILALSLSAPLWAGPPDVPPGLAKKLVELAETEGEVRVIVGLQLPGRPFKLEGHLPDQAAVGQQRAAIAQARQSLMNDLLPLQARLNRTYVTLPYVALSVNADALEHILNSPRVVSIAEDEEREPLLGSAGPFIGADSTWEAGFGGKGTAVAILDTGIDPDHPFFAGAGPLGDVIRIVDEACFSSPGDASLCPDTNPQFGPGSADVVNVAACYVDNAVGSGDNICTHGTHVAGIAAGRDDGVGYNGTAPEAGIVAVQVFHRVTDCDEDTDDDQPCVRTWDSDYNAGLDWVQWYALPRHNVVSANMSLGGGFYYEPCSGSASQTAIANLRSAGAATAVAAGNDGWTWAVGGPGCAPDAVTVGAVSDGDYGSGDPWVQTLWPYDVLFNLSADVDIMAVGIGVDSSIPDDQYDNYSGTSMATPQVTGAFAVLKAVDPSLTIDDAEQLLEDTGVLVIDQRDATPLAGDDDYPDSCDPPACQPYTRIQKPLLQLDSAVAAITDADLDIYKDCKPDGDKLVGEEALCFITVTNHGPDAAMDVHVTDTYISDGSADFVLGTASIDPADAGTCSETDNPQNPTGQVNCDLGAVLVGEVVTITIPVTVADPLNVDDQATVRALTPDPDTSNNASEDGLIFVEAADLRVSKLCKPDGDLLAGVTGTCEIIVENLGPSDADNVVVTDTHTSNVAFTIDGVNPGGPTCSIASHVVTCNFNTVAAGDTETIVVSIAENEPMDINDTVSVSSDMLDPDLANNIATDGLHIVGLADVSISKSDSPDPVAAGENLQYTLTVHNGGPSTAVNVVARDMVPAGTSMVSAAATQGSCVIGVPGDPAQPTVCTLGDIASGANVTVTIVVTVLPETTGSLHNDATVSSDTRDDNNGNNSATEDTEVSTVTGLSVTKTDQPDPVIAGAQLKYTVTIANAGPSTATQLSLVDTLPAEVSLVGMQVLEGVGNCIESATNVVTCDNIGDLGPGDRFKVVTTVLVDSAVPDGTVITNDVDVLEDDVLSVETSEDTTVIAEADLWIDKTGNFPTGNPSGTILYFLTVHNAPGCSEDDPQVCGTGGTSDALNVVVTDQLPSTDKKLPVEFVSEQCTYDQGSHQVVCTEPVLAAGDSVTFEIQVRAKGGLGEITNVVDVVSDTSDPDSGNNHDELLMTVQGGTGDTGGPGGGRGKGPH